MLKLIKGMFSLVHVPALREAALRMLGWESEDLSFAPVTANNKFFVLFLSRKVAYLLLISVLPVS